MLKSLTIKNFRCFENFKIEPLDRINLIGGSNNVGKTTLLEAIFLLTGIDNFNLPLQLNIFGDIDPLPLNTEDICQWLFLRKNFTESIEISAIDHLKIPHALEIELIESEKETLPLHIKNLRSYRARDLQIKYKVSNEKTALWILSFAINTDEDIGSNLKRQVTLKKEKGTRKLNSDKAQLIGSRKAWAPTTDDVENFSLLEEINRQDEILEILRILEPRLKRLAVLAKEETPMIYGDIDIGHLLPLQMMGEGMGRLAAIALTIANTENGTVLIDEIENGLHHSVLVKVWKAIADVARRSNVQIFATTHSWECIEAAHEAFKTEESYDFRYHRLGRVDGKIKSATYDRETIGTSVDMYLEMR